MSRHRGWLLAFGLIVPLSIASGCGNKPAPAPKHAVKSTAKKTASKTKHTVNTAMNKSKPKGVKRSLVSKVRTTAPTVPAMGNVAAGAKLFAASCQTCHGKNGVGAGAGPRLASPSNVVAQFGTESALGSFIQHNMPANNPGSLSATQASNAAAYVWHIAGGK